MQCSCMDNFGGKLVSKRYINIIYISILETRLAQEVKYLGFY